MSESYSEKYIRSLGEISIRRTLRKYGWLAELARKHSIHPVLLQSIVEFFDNIVHLRKESQQLDIALVLHNKQLKFEQPLVELEKFFLSDTSKFSTLKNIVNGSALCYIIDKKGMVTVGRIPSNFLKETSRLTLRNISRIYKTITLYLRMPTVEIYDSGELVRIYREGIWIKPCIVPLGKLTVEGFPLKLLELVMQLCMKSSEIGKGCTFVINKNDCLKHCSPMIKGYKFRKCRVDRIPESQILKFAGLDGAIILNTKYEVIEIGQKLQPPLSTKYFRESGRGTRHHFAAMYSSAVDSVVFVVSEDGPISLYFRGNLYARCFEELFGTK